MRGLPPPPDDVCRLTTWWEVNSKSTCSTSWWIFAPGSAHADGLDLSNMLSDFVFGCLPDLLSVLGSDVTCSLLRLATFGSQPLRLLEAPAPNLGALGGTQPLNTAAVMTWRTNDPVTGGHAHTCLPLSGSLVDDNLRTLTSIGYAQLSSAARSFVTHVGAITSPDGTGCVLVGVSFSLQGEPRALAHMTPIEFGDASPNIGTLRRRIHRDRPFSSPF